MKHIVLLLLFPYRTTASSSSTTTIDNNATVNINTSKENMNDNVSYINMPPILTMMEIIKLLILLLLMIMTMIYDK